MSLGLAVRGELLLPSLLFLLSLSALETVALPPPPHINHTSPGVANSSDDYSLEILEIGDVTGSREMIVWVRTTNLGEEELELRPELSRIRINNGQWRACYHHQWSGRGVGHSCGGAQRWSWNHQKRSVPHGESLEYWMVFELPRYAYLQAESVTLDYWPIGLSVAADISSGREPEDLPYLNIIKPGQGESVRLIRVEFEVWDTDTSPIEIGWSVRIDGNLILTGTEKQFSFCPIEVQKDVPLFDLEEELHNLTIGVWDGHLRDDASVTFLFEKRLPNFGNLTQLDLEWAVNTSEVFPGLSFGAGYQGVQTVWDFDGDGVREIVFGTRRGHSKRLWCFDSTPSFEWVYPPIDSDGLPGDPTSKVSLVDVDSDGAYELCFAGRGGRLHVLNGHGEAVLTWDEPNQQNMHGAPQALDVDGDGHVEFFLNTNDGFIHRVSHTGELVWTSAQSGSGNQGHPTIVDIDQDGAHEVLYASQDFNIYCLLADTGYEKWRFDMGANPHQCLVFVYDINNDGEYEIITWTDAPSSCIFILNHHGTELGRWTHPREGVNIRLGQAMGDVDGDGSMDMALMTGDALFCIDIGKIVPTTKWEIDQVDLTYMGNSGYLPEGAQANHWSSYQLIADIDGDGQLEILWLAPFPIVTDGATGRIEAYYANEFVARNRRQESGGWWGDVDNDGVSEWVCELNGNSHAETQLYCLTMNGSFPAPSPWPEYYHCAYPAEYQAEQDWLLLKASYSNSLHFPMELNVPENVVFVLLVAIPISLVKRRPGC